MSLSRLILEVPRSHTSTHHSRLESSGRVISPSQRPLPDNTHNTHNGQPSMPPAGFKPSIPARDRPQTRALDSLATGTAIQSFSPSGHLINVSYMILIYYARYITRLILLDTINLTTSGEKYKTLNYSLCCFCCHLFT
jgi:hypothetical protein